jgi:CheY-like chemotaxis protein
VTATPTLMLIDDIETNRQLMRAFLEAGGYSEIIDTGDGVAAFDLFANGPSRIDLLITDFARPGMDGFALIRAVREIDPDIKVLVVSGQAANETVRRRLDDASIPFLEKPYNGRGLLDIVPKLLAAQRQGGGSGFESLETNQAVTRAVARPGGMTREVAWCSPAIGFWQWREAAGAV